MPKEKAGDFRDTIIELGKTKSSAISVFSDFTRAAACALAVQTREEEYLEVAGRYERGELELFSKGMGQLIVEMEAKPFTDVLGPYYQEIASPATLEARGEFYTPESISSLIGQLTLNPEEVIAEGKPVSISEPCVGSGGMILSIAKHFAADKAVDLLRVSATDVSPVACDMTYINTTLWGIPTAVTWGNTLTMDLQRTWKNIHWFRVGEEERLKMLKLKDLLVSDFGYVAIPKDKPAEKKPEPTQEAPDTPQADEQGQFDLGL